MQEYNPTWKWFHVNEDEWSAHATFTKEDGTSEVIISDKVTHQETTDGVEYKAEVEYNGQVYDNEMMIMNQSIVDPLPEGVIEMVTDKTEVDGEVPIPTPIDVPTGVKNTNDNQEENAPEDKWEGLTDKDIQNALKQVTEMVRMMESIWKSDIQEYKVTESHIRQLYKFNEDHRDPMPEDITKEDAEKWDHFNGLKKLTEEDVEKIFGKDHEIIGVAHSQTLDRISTVVGDFFSWTYAINQYKEIYNAYQEYIEEQEEANIQQLREIIEQTDDEQKKEELNKTINFYYYRKHLGFLTDIDDKTKQRIAQAWKDSKKLDYWINRSREKLTRLKISNQIILEISQFEKRFMEPRYHRISNILLTYFLNLATYCKPDDKEDQNRNMVVCMVFALDSIIRKTARPEIHQNIMSNIEAFEEQMLQLIPDERDMKED